MVAFGEEWFVGKDGESQVSGVIPEERRLAVPAALSSRWGRGRVQSLHTCLLVLVCSHTWWEREFLVWTSLLFS